MYQQWASPVCRRQWLEISSSYNLVGEFYGESTSVESGFPHCIHTEKANRLNNCHGILFVCHVDEF